MNSIWREADNRIERYQALKTQLLDSLTDDDMGFHLGGESPTLGALCIEIGEIEQAYIDSFKTFNRDFSYRSSDPELEGSVAKLSLWLKSWMMN